MKLYYLGKAKIVGYGSMMIPDTVLDEEQLDPKALFKTRKEAEELAKDYELTLAKNLTPYEPFCAYDLWDIFEVDSNKLIPNYKNGFYELVK